MKSEITIREARKEDASAIASIARIMGWWESLNKVSQDDAEEQIASRLDRCHREGNHTVLVAERADGEVVGYVVAHWYPHIARGIDGYVSELFVHPEVTGKGTGSKLLEAIKGYAHTFGCTRLLLMNRRSRESYQRSFYAKQGWEELHDAAFFTYAIAE